MEAVGGNETVSITLQVYTSLGEEEEQPLTWRPLEEDFEFDEDIPQYSATTVPLSEKKKVSRPKLVNLCKKSYPTSLKHVSFDYIKDDLTDVIDTKDDVAIFFRL